MTPAEDYVLERIRAVMPSCVNCEHFSLSTWKDPNNTEKDEFCTLTPSRLRPPARVVAFGCPKFVQDIPF